MLCFFIFSYISGYSHLIGFCIGFHWVLNGMSDSCFTSLHGSALSGITENLGVSLKLKFKNKLLPSCCNGLSRQYSAASSSASTLSSSYHSVPWPHIYLHRLRLSLLAAVLSGPKGNGTRIRTATRRLAKTLSLSCGIILCHLSRNVVALQDAERYCWHFHLRHNLSSNRVHDTKFFNLQQFFLVAWQGVTRVELRATSLCNLQRNKCKNVAWQVTHFCCKYFRTLRLPC